jgi:ferritin-like metal-binding protein YciE
MEKQERRIIELLVEAHSNELVLANTLRLHIPMARDESYKTLLKGHLEETKAHARKLRYRLEKLGAFRSAATLAYAAVQNGMKQTLGLAKGPIDVARAGRDLNEKMLRNAIDEVMSEGLEIGAYDAIEAVAQAIGDGETAQLAALIKADEERMFEALRLEIPRLAALVAAEDADVAPMEEAGSVSGGLP